MDPTLEQNLRNPQVPFDKKWDIARPVLEDLYIEQGRSVPEIAKYMKENAGFDASTAQYKYRFNKTWKLKKNISSVTKRKIIERSQARVQDGKATSITYKGRGVDLRKLRRQANQTQRAESSVVKSNTMVSPPAWLLASGPTFGTSIFINWNLPYGKFNRSVNHADHPSPFGPTASTPSDVSMHTPPASTRNDISYSRALQAKTATERAQLFVSGQHEMLLKSLSQQEQICLSTWLHEYWYFAFKTAKHWGYGPRIWTAENLRLNLEPRSPQLQIRKLPNSNSPWYNALSPNSGGAINYHDNAHQERPTSAPSQLCHWSIHVYQKVYETAERISGEPSCTTIGEGEDMQRAWPQAWQSPPIEERLLNNIETNDFSQLDATELPISLHVVSKAKRNTPAETFEESLAFAIMSRNVELVIDLMERWDPAEQDISALYPLHLAVAYLDGSKSCCNIVDILVFHRNEKDCSQQMKLADSSGHSLLDSLMITILKSHSTVRPSTLDATLKDYLRFPGAEIDICGRWDADSDTYRELLRSGQSIIPPSWKHKFCHTSIQAVCHSILALNVYIPFWNRRPSGIFVRRCFSCGLKLELPPLHALIFTGYHLASAALEGENLFGIICCVLAILSLGRYPSASYDPFNAVEVSLPLLLDLGHERSCSHRAMAPADIARCLGALPEAGQTEQLRIGWRVLTQVLQECQDTRWSEIERALPEESTQVEMDGIINHHFDDRLNFALDCGYHHGLEPKETFGFDNELVGHIWAAAQTELLTYRRLDENDAWISANFDMVSVLRSLENREVGSIPLVGQDMMEPYCKCGCFLTVTGGRLRREDAATFYWSNLEDWHRTTFLDDAILQNLDLMAAGCSI